MTAARAGPARGGARRASEQPALEEVAAVTQRLAVLLSAGVSPVSAWGYLLPPQSSTVDAMQVDATPPTVATVRKATLVATEKPSAAVIRAAALAGPRGDSIADAIARAAQTLDARSRAAWLCLAAAWAVATGAGSPLAGSLRELAASFRDRGQLQRDLDVALAGPAATARMVMALPLIGIVFGALMGFDTLTILFATAPGWFCIACGAGLMLLGHSWNRRLVRKAQQTDPAPGLHLDLTAIAMAGGGSVDRACALVNSISDRFRLGVDRSDDDVSAVLQLASRAGVPAAELLRSAADQRRRDARSAGQRAAATLSVTLMLPLGVCVLPAFLLVGVVPLLISVVSSTVGVF
jgi:tight adherence protein B